MRPTLGLGIVCLGVIGACAQILGDDFEVGTGQGGTPGHGGDGDGGAGGDGSDAGGTATLPTGGTGGGTAVGGAGGNVGPGCDPYDFGACGANRKCSVVNFSNGDTDCISTISKVAWSACGSDGECAEGTFCSPLYGTCKVLCQSADDCDVANGAVCNVAWIEVGGAEIPGIQLCSAACNAATSAPCVKPGATCNWTSVAPGQTGFDCVEAGPVPGGGVCEGESAQDLRPDCVAGHGCFGNPQTQQGECYRWCEPIGQQGNCAGGQSCVDVGVPQFGICQ